MTGTGPTRPPPLSPRLAAVVGALPLEPGMWVLEIGCGPGAAAREIARRVAPGHVVAIDRSATAVAQARRACAEEIAAGLLTVRQAAVEELAADPGDRPFDLAVAIRVGALDGRHPEAGAVALARLGAVLAPDARLFVDGGDPLLEIVVPRGGTSAPDARPGP